MKRIFLVAAAAVLAAAVAGESKASGWGTPVPGLQAAKPQMPVGPVGDRYGYNPMLRHLMWWKKDRCSPGDGCNSCGPAGCGAPGMGMMPGGGGMMAFPNHPYARSPRDWFQN